MCCATFVRPGVPVIPACAVLPQLIATAQILERFVGDDPELKETLKMLNAIIDRVNATMKLP